jgi:hypothetical protein
VTRDRKVILGLGAICLLVGLFYAFNSPGTYQDDDVDRYYMARQALSDPELLLHGWGMPMALALFAVPARIAGYAGVEVTTVVISTGAAVMLGLAAQAVGLAFPWLAVLFLFFQPLFLELSYSALGEPMAALILSGVLWAWYRGRRDRAVVLSGFLPLARIDAGVLTVITLIAGWRHVGWGSRIGALVPVFLWNAAGFATTGELFYVFGAGGTRPFHSLGPLHYLQNPLAIVGSVTAFFFVWALVARGSGVDDADENNRFPFFSVCLAAGHLLVLSILAWESLPFGRSIGFLRHAVASAPAVALVAVWGVGSWLSLSPRRVVVRILFAAVWTVMVAAFLSHELAGHAIVGEERLEYQWWITGSLGVVGLALVWKRLSSARPWIAAAVGALACALVLMTVRPIELDPERKAIQAAVDYLGEFQMDKSVVHTNHPWFVFLTERDRYDKTLTPLLTKEAIAEAKPGSLILWENHYGNRLTGDVPVGFLRENPRFERLLELTAGEAGNFRVVIFRITG